MKQDDALSDLSNILGELKEMAIDMGCEMDRLITIPLPRNLLHFPSFIAASNLNGQNRHF